MQISTLLVSLLAALVFLCAGVQSDPREIESAELKEEYGDEFEEEPSTQVNPEDLRIVLELEHNVPLASSADGFAPQGTVEIVYGAAMAKPKVSFLGMKPLNAAQYEHLQRMLTTNQMFTVRTRANPQDASSPFVYASVPMCMLAGTRLREDITFHLSSTNQLLGMEFMTPYSTASVCAANQQRELQDMKIMGTGNALKPQRGPSPPKLIAAKRESVPKGVKPPKVDEKENPEENQSLIRKYWYIILPIVLLTVFGGDGGAEGGAAAGGAPSAGGGARRR